MQNDLAGITARRDATSARITELTRLLADETRHLEEARANLAAARAALEAERRTAEERKENLRQAEERLQQNQAAVANAEKEIARLERLSAEKQARLEVLRQMTEEGEGLEKGSQAVLKGLDDPERIRPAIAGALVASLNVEPEFVPALEAAFGRNMHAVVLRETALAAEIFRKAGGRKIGASRARDPGAGREFRELSRHRTFRRGLWPGPGTKSTRRKRSRRLSGNFFPMSPLFLISRGRWN